MPDISGHIAWFVAIVGSSWPRLHGVHPGQFPRGYHARPGDVVQHGSIFTRLPDGDFVLRWLCRRRLSISFTRDVSIARRPFRLPAPPATTAQRSRSPNSPLGRAHIPRRCIAARRLDVPLPRRAVSVSFLRAQFCGSGG